MLSVVTFVGTLASPVQQVHFLGAMGGDCTSDAQCSGATPWCTNKNGDGTGSCQCENLCKFNSAGTVQTVCSAECVDKGGSGGCTFEKPRSNNVDELGCCIGTEGCVAPSPPATPPPKPPGSPPPSPFSPGMAPSPTASPPPADKSPASSPSASPPPKDYGSYNGCFSKESTTACLLSSPTAECEHVLMADLSAGDLVLGRDGATTIVAVQHKAVDTNAQMLTFHTAEATVSMTPDHGLFVDGELVAASDAKVGSKLSTGIVKRITKSEAKIINAVTMDGTIVADGVLAASNPAWIAALTVDAPLTRAVVNAALYAAGDVESIGVGVGSVLSKIAAACTLVALAAQLRKKYSF